MSRAFVKEDDAGQAPIIPPRAALPPGTPNYVSPRGLEKLRSELAMLEAERTQIEANHEDEAERTRMLTIINGRLSELSQRLGSAKLIDPRGQPGDQVRFGATVSLRTLSGGKKGTLRKFTIVGVDEASVAEGRIAFVAPIVQAVMGTRPGDKVTLRFGRGEEVVEVVSIHYPEA